MKSSRALLLGLFAVEGLGATYYVDPAVGQMSNPGTSAAPWSTLQDVAEAGKSFQAGDEVILRSGHHGSPTIRGVNSRDVTVRAEAGARATLKSLTVRAARHWRLQGLEISPATAAVFERVTMVSIGSDASGIVVEDCRMCTVEDSGGWSATDWDTRACNGIGLSGSGNVVRGNLLRNVNFGISVTGASNVVSRNVIENFSGDGLRGLGDYGVFEYNVVKNCYDVNANHDDGFQSWSVGPGGVGTGVVRGVILRGNRIINYEDANQPHRGTLQGIGCFDGFFEDWVVENNEILTDHWHGITLSGARNCRIVNNTVVDLNATTPGPPWIRIGNHKDGSASTGNVIRNNLSTDYSVDAGAARMDHNLETSDYPRHFRDYAGRDLRLISGSSAIDAGSPELAPTSDASGLARPLDGDNDGQALWDLGAHEYAHSAADADGDGMSDAEEAVAGTSAVEAGDVLRLRSALNDLDGVVLSWPSVSGRVYTVWSRGEFGAGSWVENPIGIDLAGTGGMLRATNPIAQEKATLYRLGVDWSGP